MDRALGQLSCWALWRALAAARRTPHAARRARRAAPARRPWSRSPLPAVARPVADSPNGRCHRNRPPL
eukprot:299005-Prymnesium_polylepis.1